MSYINQPPDLRQIFDDLDQRLKKIETAQRFTSPAVATDPVNYRNGDIWLNTNSAALKTIINGVPQTIAFLEDANTWGDTQTIPTLIITSGETISGGSTIATGNLTVSAGSVSAGTGVTATTGDITATTGNITSTAGTVTGVNLTSTGTTTVGAVNFATTTTATTIGAAGGASALPATPKGYLIISVAGTNYKIPYYNV
jgi:hypothetical protein